MQRINIPESSNTTQEISLKGISYIFNYSFNPFNQRYYLDILTPTKKIVYRGLIIIENTVVNFFEHPLFDHGYLLCLKNSSTNDTASRHNIGLGKDFELVYFTKEELGIV